MERGIEHTTQTLIHHQCLQNECQPLDALALYLMSVSPAFTSPVCQ